eukprot:SAG31_NODE_18048_length_648_cov_1.468124_1_plen_35_part_10
MPLAVERVATPQVNSYIPAGYQDMSLRVVTSTGLA